VFQEFETPRLQEMLQNKFIFFMEMANKVRDKSIPLQAWTGLEGSRRLRIPDFKTIGT
jgi:hypothetical protein